MSNIDHLSEFEASQNLQRASKGARFANYLLDLILFYVIEFIIGLLLASSDYTGSEDTQLGLSLLFLLGFVFYYAICEVSFKGKTFGKLITRTKVIKTDGTPLSWGDGLKRSFSRIVPFEPLSIFFGDGEMWHDSWSDTIVVND